MKKIEILAPGGSKEAIYAAIYSGADAVYTGTDRFSARAFADNPTVEELCGILDFAHLHDKKIYLTVNTLLTEEELEGSLYALIAPLYEAGLDAVIVQDPGVMDFIGQNFQGLAIHASTQMTIVSGAGADQWKPYGVTRVVPARELTIGEIAQMRRKTDLELEVFVHGALCYCYSGQCQMSQVIGGRSGNRGMCAQPCRLRYTVNGKDGGYILSPRDLCTLGRVGELIEAGVDSFKIEGRMKKPAYAAFTSHLYRIYADAYLAGVTKSDAEVAHDVRRLADIYNRGGFSAGYLFEPSKNNVIDTSRNGHYGVCVGEVVNVTPRAVEYRLTERTHAQDVLEFRDKKGHAVYEYTLKEGADAPARVTARYQKGSAPRAGQKVYRMRNNQLLQQISDIIDDGKKNGKIKVRAVFTAECGRPVTLTLFYRDFRCEVAGARAERAEGRPVEAEDIKKRLDKTGGSEFVFERLEVHVPDGIFIPLGSIASLRREGLERLRASICGTFHRTAGKLSGELPVQGAGKLSEGPVVRTAGKPVEERVDEPIGQVHSHSAFTMIRVADIEQLQAARACAHVTADRAAFHLKLDEFAPDTWEQLSRETGDLPYYISLPAVLREKNTDRFLSWWGQCGQELAAGNLAGVIVHSMDAFPVLSRMPGVKGREILAGEGLYLWNRRTARVYRHFGISGRLYTAYGRTRVMMSEGCVNRELGRCRQAEWDKSRNTIATPKNDEFLVVNYCHYCYNEIYENMPSWQVPSGRMSEGHKPERHRPERHDPEKYLLSDNVIPEIAFSLEDASGVRKVLGQWNFLS